LLVLIDESLPKPIRRELPGQIIVFEALSNRLEHIRPLLPEALKALNEMAPGELRIIGRG